jgi:hypothetical protein
MEGPAIGIRLSVGAILSPLHRVHTSFGVQLSPYSMHIGILSQGVKKPRRETYHLPPFSDEAKNRWSYTSTLPLVLRKRRFSKYQYVTFNPIQIGCLTGFTYNADKLTACGLTIQDASPKYLNAFANNKNHNHF